VSGTGPANPIPLSRLPAFEDRSADVTVIVETPKGSPNKYGYDPTCNAFRLKAVLPEGTAFPYDFGFIPSTLGEDGDPIDLLMFLDSPAVVGCILTARLIGVIEVRQREQGGEWVSNDRLLGVATHAHAQSCPDPRRPPPASAGRDRAVFRALRRLAGPRVRRDRPGRA
jgi:inorganic pyrophosphatase